MKPDDDRLTPEQDRVRDALRGLAWPSARAEFRARLESEFVSGRIRGRAPLVARPRVHRLWISLAPAAAVAALVAGLVALNRGPAWTLVEARGAGRILVDGRSFALDDHAALARALRAGARVQMPDSGEVDLVCPGHFAFQLTPSTVMTLPKSPGRWFGRGVGSEFEAGEVRVVTGPAFVGAALVIRTPEAESRVRGTTLAVIRAADSTCVCAFDATIQVRGRDGQTHELQAGKRVFLFADGRPPTTLDIDAMETMKLGMVRDRYGPQLSAP